MAETPTTTRKAQIMALIVREVRHVLGDRPVRVFLFGSQVGHDELIPADIDVGIDAGAPLDHRERGAIQSALNESRETLYEFDVVDVHRVDAEFAEVAFDHQEPILG